MNNRSSEVHERFWSMVDVKEKLRCWPWRGVTDDLGYGQFRMDGKTIRAPRVAFFLRNRRWPNVARHVCDYPICCNPDHIIDGNHADNTRDMMDRGRNRSVAGEKHGRAMLTNLKVQSMRREYRGGDISLQELADKYGCSFSSAQRVIKRTTWRHIP